MAIGGATGSSGHVVRYDPGAGTLMVHQEEAVAAGGPLVEESGDLSTLVCTVIVFGK